MTSRRSSQGPREDLLDERLVKAISHPIRHRVLVLLNERVASPNELSRALGESLGRVSYHVRQLAEVGAIELVRTEPRRGAVEHFYHATVPAWFSDSDWARLPRSTRQGVRGQELARIGADVAAAAAAHRFERDPAHVSVTQLDLDEEGQAALAELLAGTLERAREIGAASAARGAASVATELAILHFERT
jgi:DNA-binding transcriptional ArsR family regulator